MTSVRIMALDVGERRIGVAVADTAVSIAVPYGVIDADGTEIEQVTTLYEKESAVQLIVGYPRNQSGEPTAQTQYVTEFVARLPRHLAARVIYQDESVTSIQAERLLKAGTKPYTKGDIDKIAASLILQDYLEANHGRL